MRRVMIAAWYGRQRGSTNHDRCFFGANALAGGFLRVASRKHSLLSERALLVGLCPSARGAGVRAPVARQPDPVGQLPALERIRAQRVGGGIARHDAAGRVRLRRLDRAAVWARGGGALPGRRRRRGGGSTRKPAEESCRGGGG